jgi:hypothetical protein
MSKKKSKNVHKNIPIDIVAPGSQLPILPVTTQTTLKEVPKSAGPSPLADTVFGRPAVPQPFQMKVDIAQLRRKSIFLAVPMYGGQCSGIFARSLADLITLSVKHGINIQLYFMFNESLITRARNYCADEFIRSACSHLMFIDADIGFNANDVIALLAMQSRSINDVSDDGLIRDPKGNIVYQTDNAGSPVLDEFAQPKPVIGCAPFIEKGTPYDVIGAVYPKKSHTFSTKIITQKDGIKKLGWIVKTKYDGKILNFNEKTNKMEWDDIISYSDSIGTNKKWARIIIDGITPFRKQWKRRYMPTADHECAVVENLFNPSISYVEAKNLKGKYLVTKITEAPKGTGNINPLYNSEQMECLVGTLFGDGCIDCNGYLKFGHSNAQYNYLEFKRNLFGGKISNEKNIGEYKNKKYYAKYLSCPRNIQIDNLKKIFYPNGKKEIKMALNYLTEMGLAFWYMDDGSKNENDSVAFCTESFSYEEHELIKDTLRNKFNLIVDIIKHNKSWRIYVPVESSKILFGLINKYIIPELEYKIPEKYINDEKHKFNTEKMEYGAKQVLDVKLETHKKFRQYDIGLKNNQNFFADGFLTHNCISWEKIKMAVDKGAADQNPNALENFVGDYVFNPKNGTGQIHIGSPAEVSELGTGFMMIRRETFIKFDEAYRHKLYRPDHVRTAAFDGSREIMMYFQAEIDYGTAHDEDVSEQYGQPKGTLWKKVPDPNASKRYLSEDYQFCYDLQRIGLKTWICPWMQLQHVGTYIFGGSLAALASIQANVTADPKLLEKMKGRI